MSSADAADFGFKRFRVSKACVVCRLRKTRCNGQQPCDRCQAHSAECKYETIETTSRRASRADSATSSALPVAAESKIQDGVERPLKKQKRAMIDQIAERRWGDRTPARSSSSLRKSGYVLRHLELYASIDQDEPVEDDTELHTEDGVRAHDQETGNRQFYGFTSNFNFQHRLTQTIEALRLRELHQPIQSSSSTARGRHSQHSQLPESLKMWGHHNIIFRQGQSDASFPTLDGANNSIGDSTFLPPSIVDRFIENYMTLIQPQMGAVPKRQILKWVKDAKAMGHLSRGFSGAGAPWSSSSTPGKTGLRTNELAALYVVLALGAMMDEGDWQDVYAPVPMAREGAIACATTLFLLAKKRLEEIVENSSIQSARCLVLMSFFSLQWSQPNVAYLYIGYAARMCISIGLHRETFYMPHHVQSSEHRQLWWTCYSMERMISTWFGQASAVRDDDLSTRLPRTENAYDAYLCVNARIARICSDMSRLSANPPTNASDVLRATELMDAEMLQIRADTPKDLAVGLQSLPNADADDDDDEPDSDLVVRRYSVTTFWWYLRLLIHSPLVIFALYGRSAGTSIPANVLEKINISARSAQCIIDTICNARSDVPRPGLDNMRFGSFYLDSACTIVLSAILCDPSNQELAFGYLASIDRAIKYLEKKDKIYADQGTKASLRKAKDLVALARQVVRAAAGQTASSRVQNGTARKADGRSAAKDESTISTFQTSSERGTAVADSLSPTEDRAKFNAHDPTISALLSPPSLLSKSTRGGTSVDQPLASAVDKTYASERDDWMQYFLSNFDWLGQPGSATTPGASNASPFFASHSPASGHSMGGGHFKPPTPGGVGSNGFPISTGARSASSDYSSPGSAAGPASLSELDMGLIMGGVSIMESDQQQQ